MGGTGGEAEDSGMLIYRRSRNDKRDRKPSHPPPPFETRLTFLFASRPSSLPPSLPSSLDPRRHFCAARDLWYNRDHGRRRQREQQQQQQERWRE